MSGIEHRLRRLGAQVEYPETPPIAASVVRRLEDEGATPHHAPLGWRPLSRRTALLTGALVLLLTGTVFAAVPGARNAVLDLVGLRGATVERVRTLPADIVARPGMFGPGGPSTLAQAPGALAFDPLVPATLGEPETVLVAAEPPPGGQLTLVYPPGVGLPRSRQTGAGLLINEIRGDFAPGFFGKMAPRGVRIERLRIGGRPAIWVRGLHQFQYLDREGNFRIERARLAGNTLLYQHGRVMVRIEGRIDLARAKAIARDLSR